MKAVGFIQATTKGLTKFFGEEFLRQANFPKVNLLSELPGPQQQHGESRAGFFAMWKTQVSAELYLLPYVVRRQDATRNRERIVKTVMRGGKSIAVATAGAEAYVIHYVVMGPSPISDIGQWIKSCFISTLLDVTRVELVIGDSIEAIRLQESLHETQNFQDLVNSSHTNLFPLYIFTAEVSVETGTVISSDSRVETMILTSLRKD
jgi:hypothetical protein